MSKVLYIQVSPRGKRSHSIIVTDKFIEEYRKKNPKDEIITMNVFEAQLPTFDGFTVQAKYSIMHGQKHSGEEAAAWKAVEKVIEAFKSADKYVFAVPMWNFGVPYRLKQYIDILVQPSYTFTVSDKGYEGLVKGKKAFVVYARGGDYPAGPMAAYDHQKPYLELILGFIGITDVKAVVVNSTLGGPEIVKKSQDEAIISAVKAAGGF
jgi:FMN-dependent NADH-azoreductase